MVKEYEHYTGLIVDTNPIVSSDFQTYEIPINLMINNQVDGQMLRCQITETFDCKGVTVFCESSKKAAKEAVHDIKSIDIIHNPEFPDLLDHYHLPIFFKKGHLFKQGFVDNGREVIQLKSEAEKTVESL
jgi:hypothetical protein